MKGLYCLLILIYTFNELSAQSPEYGNNPVAGKYLQTNGFRQYYEVYGSGQPLVLIHGNTTGIKGWTPQIDFFRSKYKVILMDCRGRGKSELGNDSLSYHQMADDIAVLLDHLKIDSAYVIGKSDGAIVGLFLNINHPRKVKKLVSWAANILPDSSAFYPPTLATFHQKRIEADSMLAKGDTTMNWKLEQQKYRLMEYQPHLGKADLAKISNPVLVISCDRDVIKLEHTMHIYSSLKKAHLCIVPGEVHGFPKKNPALFNSLCESFLSKPFVPDSVRFD